MIRAILTALALSFAAPAIAQAGTPEWIEVPEPNENYTGKRFANPVCEMMSRLWVTSVFMMNGAVCHAIQSEFGEMTASPGAGAGVAAVGNFSPTPDAIDSELGEDAL